MAVFIPDLFSGYINGREMAIKNNWQDQTNYNSVLKGQMDNAASLATFDPYVRSAWDTAAVNDMNTMISDMNTRKLSDMYRLEQQAGVNQMNIDARIAQLQQTIQQAETQIAELQQRKMNANANANAGANLTPPQIQSSTPAGTNQ